MTRPQSKPRFSVVRQSFNKSLLIAVLFGCVAFGVFNRQRIYQFYLLKTLFGTPAASQNELKANYEKLKAYPEHTDAVLRQYLLSNAPCESKIFLGMHVRDSAFAEGIPNSRFLDHICNDLEAQIPQTGVQSTNSLTTLLHLGPYRYYKYTKISDFEPNYYTEHFRPRKIEFGPNHLKIQLIHIWKEITQAKAGIQSVIFQPFFDESNFRPATLESVINPAKLPYIERWLCKIMRYFKLIPAKDKFQILNMLTLLEKQNERLREKLDDYHADGSLTTLELLLARAQLDLVLNPHQLSHTIKHAHNDQWLRMLLSTEQFNNTSDAIIIAALRERYLNEDDSQLKLILCRELAKKIKNPSWIIQLIEADPAPESEGTSFLYQLSTTPETATFENMYALAKHVYNPKSKVAMNREIARRIAIRNLVYTALNQPKPKPLEKLLEVLKTAIHSLSIQSSESEVNECLAACLITKEIWAKMKPVIQSKRDDFPIEALPILELILTPDPSPK